MLRIVFTGAPSSGKTSVALTIANKRPSWTVHEEVATQIIKCGARGTNEAEFSMRIMEEMLRLEAAPRTSKIEVYDRAIPDSLTYLKLTGTHYNSKIALLNRYDLVFCFDPLPIKVGGTRNNFDAINAAWLAKELPQAYREIGCAPITVPVNSIEARANFIISTIEERLILEERTNGIC